MYRYSPFLIALISFITAVIYFPCPVKAQQPSFQRKEVNWKISGSSHIKAVYYPDDNQPQTLEQYRKHKSNITRKKISSAHAASAQSLPAAQSAAYANVVNSPPIDGFIPWIAILFTNEHDQAYQLDAVPVIGFAGYNPPSVNTQTGFRIGIFDTGASAHVIGYNDALQGGIYNSSYLTSATASISGVTGSVDTWVSFPMGLFVNGLAELDPNSYLINKTRMIGETNVSVLVGQGGILDIPTAIGDPLSVYFAADIRNDRQITITKNSQVFTSPDIHFYDSQDPCVPQYINQITLELRPTDSYTVQYFPCVEITGGDCPDGDGSPSSPSVLTGFMPNQSLFFIPGVDLYKGTYSALDKQNFIIDTGAQISVIGTVVAARLGLNPKTPDFQVEVEGVNGQSIMEPGFYIDSLDIPALGDWLSFTHIPVVMLDVASPEGGNLDGIIGMNLFADLNFVLNGGAFTVSPSISFELMASHIEGDIMPGTGDGTVDYKDLSAMAEAWLSTPSSPYWNPACDLAPASHLDRIINFLDFTVLASHWRQHTTP